MAAPSHHPLSDLRGALRLVAEATQGVTGIVEGMHGSIQSLSPPLGQAVAARPPGLAGFIYRTIKGTTRVVARGLEAGLGSIATILPQGEVSARSDTYRSVLNGVCGDHLASTGNPLAISMGFHLEGQEIDLNDLGPSYGEARGSEPTGKILLLVHGLCLNDRHWTRDGHDHGAALAREFGYSPLYLRYNTGRSIAANGRDLTASLDDLFESWPCAVEELVILGHSMGGLVARSACHQAEAAGSPWLGGLRKLISLGTPHHGAPLERGGHLIQRILGLSPYSAPLTRLAATRSAGIHDLHQGTVTANRMPAPLPTGVACYAAAALLADNRDRGLDRWIGDGLVPLMSALGQDREQTQTLEFPSEHQWIGYGIGHQDLLSHPEVYQQLRRWMGLFPNRG